MDSVAVAAAGSTSVEEKKVVVAAAAGKHGCSRQTSLQRMSHVAAAAVAAVAVAVEDISTSNRIAAGVSSCPCWCSHLGRGDAAAAAEMDASEMA